MSPSWLSLCVGSHLRVSLEPSAAKVRGVGSAAVARRPRARVGRRRILVFLERTKKMRRNFNF